MKVSDKYDLHIKHLEKDTIGVCPDFHEVEGALEFRLQGTKINGENEASC